MTKPSVRDTHLAWVATIPDAELRADDTQIIADAVHADIKAVQGTRGDHPAATRFRRGDVRAPSGDARPARDVRRGVVMAGGWEAYKDGDQFYWDVRCDDDEHGAHIAGWAPTRTEAVACARREALRITNRRRA